MGYSRKEARMYEKRTDQNPVGDTEIPPTYKKGGVVKYEKGGKTSTQKTKHRGKISPVPAPYGGDI